jgi:hypothetical protein
LMRLQRLYNRYLACLGGFFSHWPGRQRPDPWTVNYAAGSLLLNLLYFRESTWLWFMTKNVNLKLFYILHQLEISYTSIIFACPTIPVTFRVSKEVWWTTWTCVLTPDISRGFLHQNATHGWD